MKRAFFIAVVIGVVCVSAFGAKTDKRATIFVQDGLIGGVRIEAARLGKIESLLQLKQGKSARYSVVVGRIDQHIISNLTMSLQIKVDKAWLSEQGYQIVVIPYRDRGGVIVVTGATDVGVLYGVIGLRLRMNKLGMTDVSKWRKSYRDRPLFKYRGGKGPLRGNWQTSSATREPMCDIFLYKEFPEIYPGEEFKKKYLAKVAKTEKKLRKQLANAKKYGTKVFFFTYQPTIISWGRKGFFKKHPEAKAVFDGHRKVFLCPSAKISRKFIYTKWRNLFRRFPSAAGVLLCMCSGDGAGPYCGCDRCKKYPMRQRVIDYVKIIRSAIQSVNPKAVVVLRSWGLPTDMSKLVKDLPDDVHYFSKITCPPGNDYLWHDHFCRYLKLRVPRFVTCGTCGANTDGSGIPFLMYTGRKQKARAIKIFEQGCVGPWAGGADPDSRPKSFQGILLLPSSVARIECGWDPYKFDPDEFLLQWASKRFGKAVGKHVYDAFKDTKIIADAFTSIAPLRTNYFHMFVYPGCRGAGYGGATPLRWYPLAEEIRKAKSGDVERIRKKLEITKQIKVSLTALRELEAAAKLAPKNKEIRTYLTMARSTACLTRMWENYHLSLLYKCVEKNSTDPAEIKKYAVLAGKHAMAAYELLPGYLENYLKIYPYLLYGPYYSKHPGTYNAFIVQQVTNAFHQAVLRTVREKNFPVMQSRLGAKEVTTKADSYSIDISKGGAAAVKMLTRKGAKTMVLRFEGDLSNGGMLHFVYGPFAEGMWYEIFQPYDLHRKDRYNGAYAKLEFRLDGKKIATIQDFMTRHSRCNLLRYVRLPRVEGRSHKIEITLAEGNAARFQRVYIYGPKGSKPITPHLKVVDFAEDFSRPVAWKVSAVKKAGCEAKYDARTSAMRVKIYRRRRAGVVYQPLGQTYGPRFVFECDITWSKIPKDAIGAFKLFGGTSAKQWRLNPTFRSHKEELYGPTREGHYGFYMDCKGDNKVGLSYFINDSFRLSVRTKGPILKTGEKYRLKIERFDESVRFTFTDSAGAVAAKTEMDLSGINDFNVDKVGLQNYTIGKCKSPIKVQIDNIRVGQYAGK